MDIACGTALCMGVKLPENFNHPYFAKGIDDYWRRWHITLGAWFKDYIFYPLSISKFSLALGKKSKKIFKKHANKVPAIFGLIIVWFLTGLWHGASWNYVLWGLYFGLIIIFGIIVEPLFDKFYNKTKINRNAGWVNAIRLVRTLLLLAFGKILFETASLSGTFDFISKLFDGNNYFGTTALYEHLGWASFIVAVVLSIAVLVVDIIQERHPTTTFLDKLRKIPLWVQWTLFILLIVCIVWFGYYGSGLPKFEFGYVVF
jgi:D-alanyl-lipoteichoic acid acyltransferase DltB (MBOAT superfamily)